MPHFGNLHPHPKMGWKEMIQWKLGLRKEEDREVDPRYLRDQDLQSLPIDPKVIHRPDPKALQLTWLGHSSFLLQVGGLHLLLDPVLGDYCAPFPIPSLKRRAPIPLRLEDLPPLDGVLISHNHYDHLEKETVRALSGKVPFHVPKGLQSWMRAQGVRECEEYDWWEIRDTGRMTLHFTPAQHFSSRGFHDRNRTLWGGWVMEIQGKRLYYAGDSGYAPLFQDIGKRLGPMDLAILPIGAYQPRWFMKPVHLDAEEAVQVHLDVGSRQSIACHWGTFRLTDEPWAQPPALLRQTLAQRGLLESSFSVLQIGETWKQDGFISKPTA